MRTKVAIGVDLHIVDFITFRVKGTDLNNGYVQFLPSRVNTLLLC